MPPPVTGKQRAARIPLDYFKRSTFLDWGRGWLALFIAAIVALGWAASGWLVNSRGQAYYSPGSVTAVHATWDQDCMACHTPFTPLSGDAYAKHFVLDTHAMNQKCEACHAGPAHHAEATPELACAACHHDHRGRDASLVSLADGDCTQCHADLTNHMSNGKPTIVTKVTAFTAAQHPEFKVLRDKEKDPGKLKFNHAYHLQAELHLTCDSCHHLDPVDPQVQPGTLMNVPGEVPGGEPESLQAKRGRLTGVPVAAVLPARATGAYYLPINYETDCKTCHPLAFAVEGPLMPHRLQPAEVDQLVENYYAGQYLEGNQKTPVPLTTAKIRDFINGKVQTAQSYLWTKTACGECHVLERGAKEKVTSILPTNVPDIWFKSARFDHSAHRFLDCQSCHKNVSASKTNEDVLLPGVSTCLNCHAPRSGAGSQVKGGARDNCTECHSYHNGREPFAGIGAQNRAPAHPGSIEEFLTGSLRGGNSR